MKQQQPVRTRAEDFLLGRPLPGSILEPREPRNSDWLAQPYFGPVVKTYLVEDEEELESSPTPDPEEDF